MHISLPISKETILMGSDRVEEWAADFNVGNNFSILIKTDSKEHADNYFNNLSKDGEVKLPMD